MASSSASSPSSNIFQQVMTDPQGVETELLGPSYPYYKYVRPPQSIGMSDKGTIGALTRDIDGLVAYVDLLVSGKSKASATGGPLGDKFFLQTGATCTDPSGNSQTRYLYFNNVPDGDIPFISSGLGGTDFSQFRGLVPGSMSNLSALNPFSILQGFMMGSNPQCQAITMQVIDASNNDSSETHYVATSDISAMDPCWFPNGQNPVSKAKCLEAFRLINMRGCPENGPCNQWPKQWWQQAVLAVIALGGLYGVNSFSRVF